MSHQVSRLLTITAALTILGWAGWLRLYQLDRIPPGIWVDEAIEGLQAHAVIHGEPLPASVAIPVPRWPLWCLTEAASISLFGNHPASIRLPVAIAGIATVITALVLGTRHAGWIGGITAAGFLATSFWHVQFSRMALPCILAVLEGLIISVLLLNQSLTPFRLTLILLSMIVAIYGYAAEFATPIVVVFFFALRIMGRGPSTSGRSEILKLSVGVITLTVLGLISMPETVSRALREGMPPLSGLATHAATCFGNWFMTVSTSGGIWVNFPAGAPRFSKIECGLILAGLVAMFRSSLFMRWQKLGIGGWIVLASLPEILPGTGIHLIRALPFLAPATILAGIGGAAIVQWAGRPGLIVVLLSLCANGFMTSRILNGPFATSPQVATWYGRTDLESASALQELASQGSVALAHVPAYEENPVLRFLLIDQLDHGTILGSEQDLDSPRLLRVFRDPVANQPVLCLLESAKPFQGRRHVGLVNLHGLVAPAQDMLRAGNPQAALRHLHVILKWTPDSATVHGKLGLVELALGHHDKALEHLQIALRFIPNDPEYRAAYARVSERKRIAPPSRPQPR